MSDWHHQAFYRVSVKALIRNDKNELLMVDEGGDGEYGLPGGGWDYGETMEECLRRELYEEVAFQGEFRFDVVGSYTFFNRNKQAWQLLIICGIDADTYTYGVGADATSIAWKNIESGLADYGSGTITDRIAKYLRAKADGKPHTTIKEEGHDTTK